MTKGGRRSKWGEGPLWHGGRLLYVDIEGHVVVRLDPDSGEEEVWDVGERVGTVVPRAGGGLVIAGDSGLRFLDDVTGEITAICDPEEGEADTRFNDGKCDPAGRLWAGTMSFSRRPVGSLYRLDPDLSVRRMFGPVTVSNGLVWSAEGRVMYYIDTPRKSVLAFPFEMESGEIGEPEVVVDTREIEGSPDGMAIDEEGLLWVAFCHGGTVRRFDPAGGREVGRLDFPAREVTAVAFGGEGLGELFVTSGIPKEDVEERAGEVFRVAAPGGVRGVVARVFGG
jgi:sugar lactone lactonase YvrE